MKKKVGFLLLGLAVLSSNVMQAQASAGRLRNNSIKVCNGVTYGQHSSDNHWHVASRNKNGTYNATGSAIYTDPCSGKASSSSGTTKSPSKSNSSKSNNSKSSSKSNSTKSSLNTKKQEDTKKTVVKEDVKSSDNTLKKIVIDGQDVRVANSMNFETFLDTVKIDAETNDSKETYKIDEKKLDYGNNKINITVVAENGKSKSYVLNVFRKKSNNTNVKITVMGKELEFSDDKAAITVENDVKKLDYDYVLEDNEASLKVNDEELKVGENKIDFVVTAHDGTKKTYELIVDKKDSGEVNSRVEIGVPKNVVDLAIFLNKLIFDIFKF